MTSQASYNDVAEMEICLTNLIVISSILGEDEHIFIQLFLFRYFNLIIFIFCRALENLNPNALYFQKKREAIEKIE